MPYGGSFFRWAGLKNTFLIGKESLDIAGDLQKASSGGGAEEGSDEASKFIETLSKNPIHFGTSIATSFLTNNFGVGVFSSVEPDLRMWKRGDPYQGSGTPSFVLRNETYGGIVVSGATRVYWDWLSLGVSLKKLYVKESQLVIDLFSQAVSSGQDAFLKALIQLILILEIQWMWEVLFFYKVDTLIGVWL